MILEHLADLVEEDLCSRLGRFIGLGELLSSSTEKDFAFGEESSHHGGKSRDAGSSPEQGTPGGVRDKVEINNSGDEIADSVTLLDNATGKTTSLGRDVFEGGGRG